MESPPAPVDKNIHHLACTFPKSVYLHSQPMKPTITPRSRGFFIEPLEARIAPATIRIGAIGPVDNETDTEYTEGPNHVVGPDLTGPNGLPDGLPDPRPDNFA